MNPDPSTGTVFYGSHLSEGYDRLYPEELYRRAIDGAIIAVGYADQLLNQAINVLGPETPIEYPDTAYELPTVYGFTNFECHKLGDLPLVMGYARRRIKEVPTWDNAIIAGESTVFAADVVEILKYAWDKNPYAGKAPEVGFVGDTWVRKLGISLVDDTIPGAAVLIGKCPDPKALAEIVTDCQNKGMLILATFDTIQQLREQNIKVGLEIMLYPLGFFTAAVHAVNIAVRSGISFGGIPRGDTEGLRNYLRKRLKAFVLHFGPHDYIKTAAEFGALYCGFPIITDQPLEEEIPDMFVHEPDYSKMVQRAIEIRPIHVKLKKIDIPVAYGPAFEGESIRKGDMYFEAGGTRTPAFEVVHMHGRDEVEDGKITMIGPDLDDVPVGSQLPLGIIVDVYGGKMQEDFESVLERRIHQFTNFAEGAWHTGQRDLIWIRISKDAHAKGLRIKHLGTILHDKLKDEFAGIVDRVQVTLITEEAELKKHLPAAKVKYDARDARIAGLTDEAVDTFYTCTLCQSFAPNHVCVISPERLGLCGAINWLDAKASKEIASAGPNQPIAIGECLDSFKGEWAGVNDVVIRDSHGKVSRFNMYTIMENPTTSCGCFECIIGIIPEANGMMIVNREYPEMTPAGMKFSTLAGTVGGGNQTPGFLGVGRQYIYSKKFLTADGGLTRIVWMPKMLKDALEQQMRRRCEELGIPDFFDKIADETKAVTAEELLNFLGEVKHPALTMDPLM
jgi:acetyl-CoA synthase